MSDKTLTESQVEGLRKLGHGVRDMLDEVVCQIGADGHEFSSEELVVLHALELIRFKLFSLTCSKAFRSAEDALLADNLAGILLEMKDLEFSRLRGRADFQAYIQGGR